MVQIDSSINPDGARTLFIDNVELPLEVVDVVIKLIKVNAAVHASKLVKFVTGLDIKLSRYVVEFLRDTLRNVPTLNYVATESAVSTVRSVCKEME